MMHPADSHDTISVRGARENNLKNIDLDLPKRRLTVFTGVSGSGKSSLAFQTIAAESKRLVNETYSAFIQGFMPTNARPDVDVMEGLTTAIVVDQERMATNPRSTVGTATDANALLRILFSKVAQPHIGGPQAFSFNTPSVSAQGGITIHKGKEQKRELATYHVTGGMCPNCEGRGAVSDLDVHEILDWDLSLNDGAIQVPGYKPGGWSVRYYSESGLVDPDKKITDYSKQELDDLLYKEPVKMKFRGINTTYEGFVPKIRQSFLQKDRSSMQPHIRAFVDRAVTFLECPECHGTRLAEGARTAQIDGATIADACAMQITELRDWVAGLDKPGIGPLQNNLHGVLDSFVTIGLGYLSLDRPAGTLSGGEAQRTKMIKHLGSPLTDVTYVFDEPTIGLHPHDIDRMNSLLLQLRDKGNTVLVVEHKPETIAIADNIVDIGPLAGAGGGHITYEGDVEGLTKSDTVTGRHLADRVALKDEVRKPEGQIEVRGANKHNLKNVDVDIPLGVLTVVTGVAGSGKSTLIHSSLPEIEGLIYVDQTAIRGSRRSNPATHTGLLDHIRKAFAKENGVKPALFSPNSEGACQNCKGLAVVYTELSFFESVASPCEVCGGDRFQEHVLDYAYHGKNIADVLRMTVSETAEFFIEAKLRGAVAILERLNNVGLGYITLGQPLSTLSGGERQRIKLAKHMEDKGGIYVLDEPTAGLHLADIEQLLGLLDHMVDSGISVIVIEHHQAVMARADWIIDLGPGAGTEGGNVVFSGTPHDLITSDTVTGEHLAEYLK